MTVLNILLRFIVSYLSSPKRPCLIIRNSDTDLQGNPLLRFDYANVGADKMLLYDDPLRFIDKLQSICQLAYISETLLFCKFHQHFTHSSDMFIDKDYAY